MSSNHEPEKNLDFSCPLPITDYKKILLAHGSGGTLTHQLISKVFLNQFQNDYLKSEHDGAVININGAKLAYSTDSFVVEPIFFPGGNIGTLAVNGTVNDLSMCGAKPLFISVGFILEEGFEMDDLWKIVQSMQKAAKEAGVEIITGDTKVVERGKGDKIFINTSGIGLIDEKINISPSNVKPGDKIILSGTIADHGISILASREHLNFESTIKSDCAPFNGLVERIFSVTKNVSVMRDPTRGGIASTLNEIAKTSQKDILIREEKIKIKDEVKAACEILGFDPLYVANEGKMLCFVEGNDADNVLSAMRSHPLGKDAEIIGEVLSETSGKVILQTTIGTKRIVDMLTGEQLPRIC